MTAIQGELKKRVLTGLIGVPAILLLLTVMGRVGAAVLALGISLAMLYEFCGMVLDLPDRAEKRGFILGLAWLLSFANFFAARTEYGLLLAAFFLIFGYFLFTAGRHEGQAVQAHLREMLASFFGLIYLLFLPFFVVLLRDGPSGHHWAVLFFLIIWSTDTGAYFIGKKFGRRRLYEAISPKKSVEGLLGGVASALLVTIVYKLTLFRGMGWFLVFALPIGVGAFSQVGDLCESFIKRAFDKKDSSSILPGHGGFLDRFDGVLFGLPVMYGCVRIFS